ncbi:MAG: hemolysin family protein, partial [Bacteroidota bacterium]|nr:hemolysin family protein [Bacteroidota bacterium]
MSTLLIIVITLLLSAFFSGMEIAFISSNKLKLELENKKGGFSARILRPFLDKPSRLISALLLGNNVALVIYGMSMAALLNPVITENLPKEIISDTSVLFVNTIISTIIILFFAEFIPKVLFRLQANKTLAFFAVPITLFYYIFYPLISLYLVSSEFILKRLFKMNLGKEKVKFNFVDLDDYLKEFGAEEPDEDIQQEIQMFQNAIEFRSIKLRECLVPRNEIVAIEENESLEVLIQLFIKMGLSRIMLYSGSIDNIIGYVHSSDLFKTPEKVKSICRAVIHLPETMLASDVLPIFVEKNLNVAVVVDEFGGTAGLVTMEDVIEEIFGEIE